MRGINDAAGGRKEDSALSFWTLGRSDGQMVCNFILILRDMIPYSDRTNESEGIVHHCVADDIPWCGRVQKRPHHVLQVLYQFVIINVHICICTCSTISPRKNIQHNNATGYEHSPAS